MRLLPVACVGVVLLASPQLPLKLPAIQLTALCGSGYGSGTTPAVDGVRLNTGPITGGTLVTLTGCGFTGTSSVKFGTANATPFSVDSDTSISVFSPAHATGTVDVSVTTPLGTSPAQTADQFTFVPVGHCGYAAATALPNSPQNVGTPVTVSVGATCTNASPYFMFWLAPPGTGVGAFRIVQPYSTSSTWNWDTSTFAPGTYTITVWALDAGSAVNGWDTYSTITFTLNNLCVTAGVAPDKASPQTRGVTVTLIANSSGCTNPEYEYWFKLPGGAYALARAYGGAVLAWDTHGAPTGTYQLIVWVREVGSSASYETYALISYALNPDCVGATVAPDKPSPQPGGTTVTFTAMPTGCMNPEYEYWFKLPSGSYALARGYDGAVLAWDTHGAPVGTYQIIVWVRDVGSSASYDTYALISYTIS
jgi:hypothetical protein